jgi:hypothetical protein
LRVVQPVSPANAVTPREDVIDGFGGAGGTAEPAARILIPTVRSDASSRSRSGIQRVGGTCCADLDSQRAL